MSNAQACEIRSFRRIPPTKREELCRNLTDDDLALLAFNSKGWWGRAREDQLPPLKPWTFWFIIAGRGWGKTRTGAEFVRNKVDNGLAGRVALIAKDPGEARDVMIEGESGLLAVSPPEQSVIARKFRPKYEPSKKRVTWPSGAYALVFSSEEYEELRGPQHDLAWCDEPAKYRYLEETLDNLLFGLRLGVNPQAVFTTTPRPLKALRALMKDPLSITTRGRTYDNLSNLSTVYRAIIRKYEGTRLGRQELEAEFLDDNPNALWSHEMFEATRVRALPAGVTLLRVVVAIDPSASEDGAEAGIIAAGKGSDLRYYVLEDATLQGRPEEWARAAIELYIKWRADRVVAEINNGGAMVEAVLRAVDRTVPYRGLTASRNKITRAEPISALYEQGLVSHVGMFAELEDQCCEYVPDPGVASPDRMDALVWCLTELSEKGIADIKDAVVDASLMITHKEQDLTRTFVPPVGEEDMWADNSAHEGMHL